MSSPLDPELLSWLAECQRNRFVAVPIPENLRATLRQGPQDWTSGISYLDREIEYEPRSLAVSLNGTRIAVGTKAAKVHLACWSGEDWTLDEVVLDTTPREADPHAGRPLGKAIRGLCFLGQDLLVAGGGAGLFTVFDVAGQERSDLPVQNLPPHERPKGEDPWLLRFAKILPLFPGSAVPTEPGDALAVGLTYGRYLHVLRRGKKGTFQATFTFPEDLLGLPPWREAWIVDGEWWDERLWLLDSRGRIHCLRPGGGPLGFEHDSTRPLPEPESGRREDKNDSQEPRGSFKIPYSRPRTDPRSISLCRAGIGVCFGEDFTFLSFRALEKGDLGNVQWVAVPGATRFLAVQEFGKDDWAYLAVATSGAGVRWIPGRLNNGVWEPSNRGGQQPLSGSARDPVLEMALVRTTSQAGQVYLALGTRGHRFRIASLLDKGLLRDLLDKGIRQALQEPAELDTLLAKATQPGMALRLLRRLIDLKIEAAYRYGDAENGQDKGPLAGPGLIESEALLFDALDLSDLPDVLRHLGKSWRAYHRRDQSAEAGEIVPPPARRAEVYRHICLLAFQRAARIDEKSLRALARDLLAAIEDLRRDLAADEWRSLGLFGGFLRKWFVYGYTYGAKHENLLQLSEWNRSCGRDLDAIVYLTRILRSRLDASWVRTVEPTGVAPSVWDVAASGADSFLLHSHTDGRIFATSQGGRPMLWVLAHPALAETLDRGAIEISDAGLALCHREAERFRERYRHGPYARSLYVERLETEHSFLVVFGIRGWHPTDLMTGLGQGEGEEHDSREPRLVALVVEWSGEEENPRLVIRDAAISILDFEPYAIAPLPRRGPEDGSLEFVIGTGGGTEIPFAEARILPGEGGGLTLTWRRPEHRPGQRPEIRDDPRWHAIRLFQDTPQGRATRFDQGSNPCWTAQAVKLRDTGAVWLWLGMQDGRVRPFLWDAAERQWLEGGPRHRNEQDREGRPMLDPILTYSPLRRLRVLEPPSGTGPGLLAYGNAAGVLGVVPLDRLSGARPEHADLERPLPERNEPWIHLIHTREKRAICGLADYQDGGDWNLAVLTESGRIAIFNLEHRSGRGMPRSFVHRGLQLDYFLLSAPYARALFAGSGHEPECWEMLRSDEGSEPVGDEEQEKSRTLPFLVIGGEDGTIRRHALAFPKFSLRRNNRAVPRIIELFHRQIEGPGDDPVSYLERALGKKGIHYWLRLCDVGGKSLLRFSLWYELRDLLQRHFPASGPPAEDLLEQAKSYLDKLRSLADEVYGRKPFDTEAAKILWSETARYANKVAAMGVLRAEVRGEALKAYQELLIEMDHLSNRWIGAGQPVEARVLMHSFANLFDWPCIVLLALDEPGEELQRARQLLLFQAVQRRLRHNDLLVPLETIRVINTAILRAIVEHRREHREWSFAHRPHKGNLGFYDLLTLVSNLVRQQAGRLTPSDPLYSEISKFLALSLLLIPDGIFAVGRLVSASRLAEHEIDVGRRILLYARMFQDQLDQDFGIPASKQPITRFEDYLSREVDLEIDGHPLHQKLTGGKHPWRHLLSDPWAPEAPVLTDPHYLSEQRQVLFTVARLAHLEPVESPPDEEIFAWLADDADEPKYFQESRAYLKYLREQREKVMSPSMQETPSRICDRQLRDLDEWPDLVEPQKSHYRSIIEHWRRELDQRGQQAIDLVNLIERFNRHVYRTSADDLMVSLMELALRSAPLAFPPNLQPQGPLRLNIRDQIRSFPFISELFRRGTLLVQGSHLAAALLYLATVCLNRGNAPGGALFSWQYKLAKIKEKAEEIAGLEGVDLKFIPDDPQDVLVPGDEFVWSTILRELARNVYDYCTPPNGGRPKLRLVCSSSEETAEGQKWFLAAGGGRSFYDALGDEPRRDVGTPPDPAILANKVEAILREPGVRYQTEPRGSFGFGLYLLHKLFELLGGAQADLLLLDPEHLHEAVNGEGPEASLEKPQRSVETLPLTMVFSWTSRR